MYLLHLPNIMAQPYSTLKILVYLCDRPPPQESSTTLDTPSFGEKKVKDQNSKFQMCVQLNTYCFLHIYSRNFLARTIKQPFVLYYLHDNTCTKGVSQLTWDKGRRKRLSVSNLYHFISFDSSGLVCSTSKFSRKKRGVTLLAKKQSSISQLQWKTAYLFTECLHNHTQLLKSALLHDILVFFPLVQVD